MQIVRAGLERLDDLGPLWKAMHAHHGEVAPRRGGLTPRAPDAAWPMRRRLYEAHLAQPDAFALIAESDGIAIGYAVVGIAPGPIGYEGGDRVGEVDTLSVLPDWRGRGVGTALMDAVERELASAGIEHLRLGVVAGNERALRFYERRGLTSYTHILLGRVGAVTPRSSP